MFEIRNGRLYQGECLEVMNNLPEHSVDMVLCDLPYGVTSCSWDSIIPFKELWKAYQRVCKHDAAIVLTAVQPFTTALIASNQRAYKHMWYWKKRRVTGFGLIKTQPLRCMEDIIVFSHGRPVYRPQGLVYAPKVIKRTKKVGGQCYAGFKAHESYTREYTNYPRQMLIVKDDPKRFHPTQKPVALFEYLIRTYSKDDAVILDNCSGSGTTAIAAEAAGRQWICIEQDAHYIDITRQRLAQPIESLADSVTYS